VRDGDLGSTSRALRPCERKSNPIARPIHIAYKHFDFNCIRLFLSDAENSGAVESITYFNVSDVRSAHAELTKRGVDGVPRAGTIVAMTCL